MKYIYKIPLIPPSNNKYLGNGTKASNFKYQNEKKQWAEIIAYTCRPKPPYPIARAIVTLHYFFKDARRRDPDNYSGKFILDGLVKAGILQDDSFAVIDLVLKADIDPGKKGYTIIEVEI
jgi:Holliday junction resolvase RusA-like endonuclease